MVVVLLALAPVAALVFIRASFFGLTARASTVLDDQYTADRVLDGDPDTEWAANGEEWLEIRFRSRIVHSVSILNGDTLPDRAASSEPLPKPISSTDWPATVAGSMGAIQSRNCARV
jgi:hypothetical protein